MSAAVPLDPQSLLAQSIQWEWLMRRIASSVLKSRAQIDEVIQDVRITILTHPPGEPVLAARSWLATVTRHRALDVRRKDAFYGEPISFTEAEKEAQDDEQPDLIDDVDPARNAEADDELRVIAAAVARLPERCKQVFVLRKVYGYSQAQIGVRLGIELDTVDSHMTRAVKLLSGMLERQIRYNAAKGE